MTLAGQDQSTVELELDMGNRSSIDIQMSKDRDIFGGYLSVGYLGSSIRVADYYLDSKELRVTVPMLSDSVFLIDRSTLNDDLDALVVKGQLDEETAESLKALNTGSAGAVEYQSEMDAANKKVLQMVVDLYDQLEVEKIESEEFLVNGKQQKCKGYRVKVNNDQIADFYLGVKKICEEEPEYAAYMKSVIESSAGISLSGEMGEEDSLGQTLQEVADYFREENYYVDADIYIYKDIVAHMQIDFAGKASAVWGVYGGDFPLENTELVISAKGSADAEEEVFRLERGGSNEEDDYQAGYRIVFDGDETFLELQFQKDSGDFSLEFGDDYDSILAEGNINKSGAGKEFVIGLDSLSYGGEEMLSGELSISGEAGEIEKPEGDTVNLLSQLLELPDYGSYMDGLFSY